jgi:hypothetical protein
MQAVASAEASHHPWDSLLSHKIRHFGYSSVLGEQGKGEVCRVDEEEASERTATTIQQSKGDFNMLGGKNLG